MAVLVEAFSVIVRRASIDCHFEGGWTEFQSSIPNQTACTDEALVRIGFLDSVEVYGYINFLVSRGLVYEADSDCGLERLDCERTQTDIALVDQLRGPLIDCSWLEFGMVMLGEGNHKIKYCSLISVGSEADSETMESSGFRLAIPQGWKPENSASFHWGSSSSEH
jgi:hypothetical protein